MDGSGGNSMDGSGGNSMDGSGGNSMDGSGGNSMQMLVGFLVWNLMQIALLLLQFLLY